MKQVVVSETGRVLLDQLQQILSFLTAPLLQACPHGGHRPQDVVIHLFLKLTEIINHQRVQNCFISIVNFICISLVAHLNIDSKLKPNTD